MDALTGVGTVALAVCALFGIVGGIVVWFYKRGGQERAFADALERNTAAVAGLTEKVDSLGATLVHYDYRLATLERGCPLLNTAARNGA